MKPAEKVGKALVPIEIMDDFKIFLTARCMSFISFYFMGFV